MFNKRLKFIIHRDGFSFDRMFELRVGVETSSGKWALMQPVEFKVIEESDAGLESRAAMAMSKEDLQSLMDEIWSAGVRPSEGSGSAGSLAATERHLADMRALVFKQFGALSPSQAPL